MVGLFRTRQKGDLLVSLEGPIHTTKKQTAQPNFDVLSPYIPLLFKAYLPFGSCFTHFTFEP